MRAGHSGRSRLNLSGRLAKMAMAASVALVLAVGGGAAVALRGKPVAAARPPAPRTTTTTVATPVTTAAPVPTTTTARPVPAPGAAPVSLVTYGGCPQLLAAVKTEALAEVGPYGFGGQVVNGAPMYASGAAGTAGGAALAGSSGPTSASAGSGSAGAGGPEAASAAQAPTAEGANGAPGYSGTNNQETGVDEPDLTKTDGHLLVVLRHQPVGLEVAEVSGATPHLDGFLGLPQVGGDPQLFLTGGYAVIVAQGQWEPAPAVSNHAGGSDSQAGADSQVVVVSLADPAHPAVVRKFDLQGSEQGARLIAGRILVVLQGNPTLPFVYPSGNTTSAMAIQQNRAVVRSSSLADWLPSVSVSPGGVTKLAGCRAALHPTVASGLGTVSVVSLDPRVEQPGAEVTVVGNASTVYASTKAVYVATSPWAQQLQFETQGPDAPGATGITTDVHGFDLSSPAVPRYLGSGVVPGTVIGQYALSEYAGDLRVATTVGEPDPAPHEGSAPAELSDNLITVLAPRAGTLVTLGAVGGLGRGEKIYGVRFVGPLGYVVTFRQTDPLYVVDLSNPVRPSLEGQLDLTGYSSFLQPLAGSLLLGVGEAVDANLRQVGLQLSVFDVANPNAPVLRSRIQLDNASTTAASDPHALLWWPARRLVAMPVSEYGYSSGSGSGSQFNGVIVWNVGTDGTLHQVARLAQPQAPSSPPPPGCSTCAPPGASAPSGGTMMMPYRYGASVERAQVIGPLLYTVSDAGIMANNMTTWSQAAWLAFPGGS